MQKTREDIIASLKTGAGSMALLLLSIVFFIMCLWVVTTLVRLVAGLTI